MLMMLFPSKLDVNVLRRVWARSQPTRGPGESYSDVIIRLAEGDGGEE
jgi:hypothetical protein